MRVLLALAVPAALIITGCGNSSTVAGSGAAASALTAADARALALQAYVYGYAPLTNYAKQSPRAFDRKSPTYTGTNKLFNLPLLMNPLTDQVAGVPSPNNDTLYSSGVLDLSQQPVVVSAAPVPDASRYYSLQLLDLDTNVPALHQQRHQPEQGRHLPHNGAGLHRNDRRLEVHRGDPVGQPHRHHPGPCASVQ